jgi:putative Holliday junction resolvase
MGRLIGLDHGIKRIGVAASDVNWLLAREVTIIHRTSKAEDFAKIHAIAQAEDAVGFIVGMPNNHAAPAGVHTQAETVRLWISRLQATTPLPIIEWDEQLTSEDARELARLQRRKADTYFDDLAARVILQSYLDALHDGLATFPLRPPHLRYNDDEHTG